MRAANIHAYAFEASTDYLRGRIDLKIAEANHRVANSLSLAATMLRMLREQTSDCAVRAAILGAETRIVSIAKFHAYLHGCGSDERVNLADFFRELLPEIGASTGGSCLLAVNASKALEVSKRVARQLIIIVNELALNSRKHGYNSWEGGCISIELDFDGRDRLKIRFADSGTGLPDDFDPENGSGLGLRIVSSLLCELGGSIASHTDGGAHFTIEIPVD